MKHLRKLIFVLALCLLLTAMPLNRAHAAEGGSMWLRHLSADGGQTLGLVADTSVASGVITITYDTAIYTFRGLTVDSAYVLAHAVNDKEAGTVKISWVGTGSGDGVHVLMRLQFTADWTVSGGNPTISLSGSVQNENGEDFGFASLDFGPLNAAVREAEGLKAEDYTADSYAQVKSALDAALAQAEQETLTPAQLDAALQNLRAALDGLKAKEPTPPEPTDPPTEPTEPPTEPTEPAPTEPTEPNPTQKPTDKPTQPGSRPAATQPVVSDPVPKGNDTLLIVGGALALCVVAAVAAVLILKKRGKK